jgi:transcriptional regulator with PAS, ATPase and Fis domain
VLIEGESGTGKELLARAIHNASPLRKGPFVAVNCGAIPTELVDSEFFGHEKGAFTGAVAAKAGFLEAANGGTLFLDEIGELPLNAQVKLLRALQEREIVRVGSTTPKKVDIRVIAATNRNLFEEVGRGRFREDLFHRLAVAVLHVPALRERKGDLSLLIEKLLEHVNADSANQPGYTPKKLSAAARTVLLAHSWPGNVRELLNTLQRAAIWCGADTIDDRDIRESLLPAQRKENAGILDRPLGNGLDLQELLSEVARHYMRRAIEESGGNKTAAAQMLGLPSYQTFSNWVKRYQVERASGRSSRRMRVQ